MSDACRQRYQIATGKLTGQEAGPSRSNGGSAGKYAKGGRVSKPSGFKKMPGKKC
jgi:hypothetical protein